MTATKIQVRRDSSTNWSTSNPVLSEGEIGLDLTTMQFKMGDGSNSWSNLEYYGAIESDTNPTGAQNGDLWVDTSVCPPELKLYRNCGGYSEWIPVSSKDFETVTLAPLTGTPNFEITAVTDITSIPELTSARYCWYQYDEAIGYEGRVKLQERVLTTTSDTYLAVAIQQGKYVGCEVTYLGTVINETQRVQCGTADVPIARMNGLRFDGDRDTYFSRGPFTAVIQTYTWSFWIKPTSADDSNTIYNIGVGADPAIYAYFDSTSSTGTKLNLKHGSSTQATVEASEEIPLNKWTHVVVAYSDSDETLRVYFNGKEPEVFTGFNPPVALEGGSDYINLGTRSSGGNHFEGYMSDFYFIQDRALTPETFGQEFLLGWGPLDKSVVKDNIGILNPPATPLSPYEARPDMSQNWSNGSGSNFGGSASNIFDNNPVTAAYPNTNTKANYTWVTPFNASKIEAQVANGQIAGCLYGITVGGVEYTGNTSTEDLQWITLYEGEEAEVTALSIKVGGGGGGNWYQLRKDGRILVNGPANNSQNWSDNSVGEAQSSYPLTAAFNGQPSEYGCKPQFGTDGITLTLDTTGYTTLTVNAYLATTPSSSNFKINGSDAVSSLLPADGAFGNKTGTFDIVGDITTIEFVAPAGDNYCYLRSLELDGVILVDAGVQWNTSQIWSDNASGSFIEFPVTTAYDGTVTYAGSPSLPAANSPAVIFEDSIEATSKVSVFTWFSSNGTADITIYGTGNGGVPLVTSFDNLLEPSADWHDIPYVGTVSKITLSISSNSTRFGGLKIDNVQLVDAPPTWNTSRTWSDGLRFPEGRYIGGICSADDNAGFDGSIEQGVCGFNNGQAVECVFDPPLTGLFEWYSRFDSTSYSRTVILTEDGIDRSPTVISENSVFYNWNVVNLEKITVTGAAPGGGTIDALRLDGEILVDAGSFGDNGFFLPFDRELDTNIYSANLKQTSTADHFLAGPPERAFDGDMTTGFEIAVPSTQSSAQAVFNQTLENVYTLEVYGGTFATGNGILRITGTNITQSDLSNMGGPSAASNSVTITNPGQSVSDLVFNVVGSGLTDPYNNLRIAKIVVNGNTLRDHHWIAADDSGNDNNFVDEHFYISDTNQIYSNGIISGTPFDTTINTWDKAFNAILDVGNGAAGLGTDENSKYTLTFNTPVPFDSLVLHISNNVSTVWVNGYPIVNSYATQTDTDKFDLPISSAQLGGSNTLQSLAILETCTLRGISVNDVLLIDGNIQDAVIDTPMNNYAVLTSPNDNGGDLRLRNGSLQWFGRNSAGWAVARGTQTLDGEYYWEDRFDNNNNPSGNMNCEYGIQRAVGASDVPTSDGYALYSATGGIYHNSALQEDIGVTEKEVVGLAFSKANKTLTYFTSNGIFTQYLESDVIPSEWVPAVSLYPEDSVGCYHTINFGQQPFYGRYVTDNGDGTVTLSSDIPNTSQEWSDNLGPDANNWYNGLSSTLAFDGDAVNTAAVLGDDTGGGTMSYTATINGDYRLKVAPNTTVNVNGAGAYTTTGGSNQWLPIGTVITNDVITISRSDGNTHLFAVEADNRILVDPDPTIDNRFVWSTLPTITGSTFADNFPLSLSFDGDTNTGATPQPSESITIDWGSSLPSGTTRINIYIAGGSIVINDTQTFTGGNGWFDVTDSRINKIQITRTGSAFVQVAAIEVDGKMLIDPTGFGGGVYSKLQQTWTEQQAAFFKLELARLGNYELALRAVAASYVNTGSFDTGAIVSHNGELWQALSDGAESTEPEASASTTWNRLGLSS